MGAPPSFLVILFLPPLLLGLCLQPRDVMTSPLHYWLVLSGDPPIVSPLPLSLVVCCLPFGNLHLVADDFIGVSSSGSQVFDLDFLLPVVSDKVGTREWIGELCIVVTANYFLTVHSCRCYDCHLLYIVFISRCMWGASNFIARCSRFEVNHSFLFLSVNRSSMSGILYTVRELA